MSESGLSISFTDLRLEVAAFLGYGPTASAWATAQLAEIDRYIQSGLRRFYYPPASEGVEAGYSWSFLKPVGTITTTASDQAQDLPAKVGRVVGGFFYDEDYHRRSIVQVSEEAYQASISRSETTGSPRICRVRTRGGPALTGQRYEVAWWPIPDAAYVFTYRYEAYDGPLADDNPYPLGGMRHSELMLESCLAVAEQRANDERGLHTNEFERLLRAAIQHDRRLGAQHYGRMGHHEEEEVVPRHGDTGGTYPITYKGSSV